MRTFQPRSSRQMMSPGILPAIGAALAIGKVISIKAGLLKTLVAGVAKSGYGGYGNDGGGLYGPPIVTNVLPPGAAALAGGQPFAASDRDVTYIRYLKTPGASQSIQKISVDDTVLVVNATVHDAAATAIAIDSRGIESENISISTSKAKSHEG